MQDLKVADIESISLPASDGGTPNAASGLDEVYIDPIVEKRTMAKFDMFMMPQMALLNLLTYLDRTNIGSFDIDT